MTHLLYVAAAYGCAALGMGGLIAWIVWDQRACRQRLTRLEASGVKRRSERAPS